MGFTSKDFGNLIWFSQGFFGFLLPFVTPHLPHIHLSRP